MTNSIFFSLINLGGAIVLYILIVRGLKDKQLKITLITTGGVTKVEKVVLKKQGLNVAIIGWAISAVLFTFSGIRTLDPFAVMGTYSSISFISLMLAILTMPVAAYIETRSNL